MRFVDAMPNRNRAAAFVKRRRQSTPAFRYTPTNLRRSIAKPDFFTPSMAVVHDSCLGVTYIFFQTPQTST